MAAAAVLVLSLRPQPSPKCSTTRFTSDGAAREVEVTLPDPPGAQLLRWRVPPGKSLLYQVTSKVSERLGQTTRTVSSAGTLRLRGVGPDQIEAEFVLRRSTAEARLSDERPAEEGAVRETFSLDSRGRPRDDPAEARQFVRLFGLDFILPEEPLSRGVALSRRVEVPVGMGGVELTTRRQTWVRTVSYAGYRCLRLEGRITRHSESPPRAGYRVVSDSTSDSVCLFAYREGLVVKLTLERTTTFTSTGRPGAEALAGVTEITQEATLKLLSTEAEGTEGGPGAGGPPAADGHPGER